MTSQPNRERAGAGDRAFTDTRRFKVMRTVIGAMNPLMRRILRSRFAGPMGKSLLLLRFRGRKSGTWRSTPVGYAREGDRVVLVTSPSYRWWHNVVGGADVQVRIAGTWYDAHARVLMPDDAAYDDAVGLQVRQRGPQMLTGFGLAVDADGRIAPEARDQATEKAHIVLVELRGPIAAPPRP